MPQLPVSGARTQRSWPSGISRQGWESRHINSYKTVANISEISRMDFIDHLKKTSQRKYLKETLDYIQDIESPKVFEIKSSYKPIDSINFDLKKATVGYSFTTSTLTLVPTMGDLHDDGYGLLKPFKLVNAQYEFVNPKIGGKILVNINSEFTTSGDLWEFETSFMRTEETYFRYIICKPYNPIQDASSLIDGKEYTHEDVLHFKGLTHFTCEGKEFDLFHYNKDIVSYYIIDSTKLITFSEFEKSVECIKFSLAFLTGIIPGNESYIIQSKERDFTVISGIRYKRENNIKISQMYILSPEQVNTYLNLPQKEGQISETAFSRLVTESYIDKRLFRAIKIIAESNDYPLEMRVSAYYVALETIKNKIIEENEEKINPFKSKKTASSMIENFKKQIEEADDSFFNNKRAVVNKIEQLNQVTNKDSFVVAFKLLNLDLTKYDLDALLRRNDFLHGRIPFEDEEEEKKDQELKYLTYKLHFLVSALILKYAGFKGVLRNNPMFASIFPGNKKIEETYFRAI